MTWGTPRGSHPAVWFRPIRSQRRASMPGKKSQETKPGRQKLNQPPSRQPDLWRPGPEAEGRSQRWGRSRACAAVHKYPPPQKCFLLPALRHQRSYPWIELRESRGPDSRARHPFSANRRAPNSHRTISLAVAFLLAHQSPTRHGDCHEDRDAMGQTPVQATGPGRRVPQAEGGGGARGQRRGRFQADRRAFIQTNNGRRADDTNDDQRTTATLYRPGGGRLSLLPAPRTKHRRLSIDPRRTQPSRPESEQFRRPQMSRLPRAAWQCISRLEWSLD
jgi:hypothetical protein